MIKDTAFKSLAVFLLFNTFCFAQNYNAINAHSHNDYYRTEPLKEALNLNFKSIEVDVFLYGEKIVVAHSEDEIDTSKTLIKLYLDPLFKIYKERNNSIYSNTPLILLIDFKSESEQLYKVLENVLISYNQMLSSYRANKKIDGAVDIVISGNIPFDTIAGEIERLASIDGRSGDLKFDYPVSLMPLISEDWFEISKIFYSNCENEMKEKISNYIATAHSQGKLIRFWNTPDSEGQWLLLYQLGVDLISTDRPTALAGFLNNQGNK